MKPELIRIDDAAAALDLPKQALLQAAEMHGYIIRVGRQKRLFQHELPELLEKCRSRAKAPDSSYGNEKDGNQSTSSETQGSSKALAQQIANKLKSRLPNTSPAKPGEVVPLKRTS